MEQAKVMEHRSARSAERRVYSTASALLAAAPELDVRDAIYLAIKFVKIMVALEHYKRCSADSTS
jgi:hypothetical protein